MARSPLTLAAAATAALPGARAVRAGGLSAGGAGRCDAALVELDDGRTVVVRAPVDESAAQDLSAEAVALRALTPGVRDLLGLRAPELLGETILDDVRVLVTDLLPGYQVDAAHLPAGEGAATSAGRALAAVHALPASVVRGEGLPVRTTEDVRDQVRSLLARVEAAGKAPASLPARWRDAVDADALWRFEPTVTLGGASADSLLFEDADAGPAVTGMLDWHGLSVGDPATDLRWLASAPAAADDVLVAYHAAAHRAPDAHLRTRARLYAELEFAKWLVHGAERHRADIVDDAVALLQSLADSVRADDLLEAPLDGPAGVDGAIGLLDRVPEQPDAADTSMQTDAYDPAQLSLFVTTDSAPAERTVGPETETEQPADDAPTGPIDIAAWVDSHTDHPSDADADPAADAAEADRASQAALRRWAAAE